MPEEWRLNGWIVSFLLDETAPIRLQPGVYSYRLILVAVSQRYPILDAKEPTLMAR